MSSSAAVDVGERSIDLPGDYERLVDALAVNNKQRWERRRAARLFLERHPDLTVWMSRPTSARLVDLHRVKAWPLFTWLVVDGRLRPDLELLLAKPGGVDLGMWWSLAHGGDVALAHEVADRLGWSPNWAADSGDFVRAVRGCRTHACRRPRSGRRSAAVTPCWSPPSRCESGV